MTPQTLNKYYKAGQKPPNNNNQSFAQYFGNKKVSSMRQEVNE